MKRIYFSAAIILGLSSIFFYIFIPISGFEIKSKEVDPVKKVMEQIRPEAIRAHTTFLSDDLLAGRRTGSPGYMLAAKYIRSQCEAFGLSGAADDKTYFQKVPLVRTIFSPNESSLEFTTGNIKRSLKYDKDFVLFDTQGKMEGSVSGDLVFVGFGITAPELGYDDYRGLDVKGKIAVMIMFEAPAAFPSAIRAYYSNFDVKKANALSHDAVGIIFIRTPDWTWSGLLRAKNNGWNSVRLLTDNNKTNDRKRPLKVVAVIDHPQAVTLFENEKHSVDEIYIMARKDSILGFKLATRVAINFRCRQEKFECVNVIASIEGSDPVLKKEYVLFTAHLDHYGIGKAVDNDSIYNGAIDNAGGCAELIELMQAYSSLSKAPKRSMVFLYTTAEEIGSLGANYFTLHPSVPLSQIVADINLDEPMSSIPVSDVIGYGSELSSLGTSIRETAELRGFTVSPDPNPEEGFFARTDIFPLVLKGIPSVWITVGTTSTRQGIDGLAVQKKWMVTNYHSPKDDIFQPIDFETAAKFNRFVFMLGYNIANLMQRPAWNKNSFFSNQSNFLSL